MQNLVHILREMKRLKVFQRKATGKPKPKIDPNLGMKVTA